MSWLLTTTQHRCTRLLALPLLGLLLVACGNEDDAEVDLPSENIATVLEERTMNAIRDALPGTVEFPEDWIDVLDVSDQRGRGHWVVYGTCTRGARDEENDYQATFVLSNRDPAAAKTARIKKLELDGYDLLSKR